MKALVIGSGAREHALAWRLAKDLEVACAPGNPGIAQVCECLSAKPLDPANVLQVARHYRADLVVVGPEDPLIAGLADVLRAEGFAVFGPGSAGAELEGSKAFSKALMAAAGVPTAGFQVFVDAEAALAYARSTYEAGFQTVVKASGAALGKGAIICPTLEEAEDAIERMLVHHEFGDAGRTVVVEDRLIGREFSLLTVVSGSQFVSLPVAMDYKRVGDGDTGLNTGGMGSVCPAGWVGDDVVQEAEARIVRPVLEQLRARHIDFRGVLFSGVLVQDGSPYNLEYNVRFGDPEIQSVVRRLEGDFAGLLHAAAVGDPLPSLVVGDLAAVSVVMASPGYPAAYPKGIPVEFGPAPEGVVVFHAGTALDQGRLVTAGGRVLTVSAVGKDLAEARTRAYQGVDSIRFEGAQWRTDIAA